MKILVLEDAQERIDWFKKFLIGHEVDFVATTEEAFKLLDEKEYYDMIYLDHDLGGEIFVESGDNTGYAVAKKMVEDVSVYNKFRTAFVFIHSANYIGAGKMQALLMDKYKTIAFPFLAMINHYGGYMGRKDD
jgi:CheY-like chemotaxis protein